MYEPAGLGGICHYTYQLSQALSRHGCEVTLLTPESYELAGLPRSFRVRFLARRSALKRLLLALPLPGLRPRQGGDSSGATSPGERLSAWFGGLRLRLRWMLTAAEIAIRRFDVVHLHSVGLGEERSLARLFRALRLTVLCTAHEVLPHEHGSAEVLEDLDALYGSATRIIVHAERTREQLSRLFAVSPQKIEVIPHGSYDFFFPRGRISRDAARARLGMPTARPTILFFGLIRRYKGLEYLTEAFARIEQALPDAMLAIVGELFRGDEAAYADYSRLLDEASRRPNVRRVAGYVPLADVGLYFSAADVVVLPYTETSQSGVLLTAFAAGRPVVVTDTGGLSEIVADGSTGFVVPARDPIALAEAILRILRDPGIAEAMGRNSAREADTTYSWDRIAAQTVRLYTSAMSEARSGAARDRAFQ
jgi:glycosyltransferase involved in cell wall biosynthesis